MTAIRADHIHANTITADMIRVPSPGDEVIEIRNWAGEVVMTDRMPQAPERRTRPLPAWYPSENPAPPPQAPHQPLSLIEWARRQTQ